MQISVSSGACHKARLAKIETDSFLFSNIYQGCAFMSKGVMIDKYDKCLTCLELIL